MATAERDRAGGDENDLLTAFAQPHEVLGERFEPGAVQATGSAVDQQCRPHLDDDAPGFGDGRGRSSGIHKLAEYTV